MYSTISLLGVRIDLVERDRIVETVAGACAGSGTAIITYSHFGILLDARRHPAVRRCLDEAAINHPDGVGASWAIRFISGIRFPRVNGSDLYPALIDRLARDKVPMSFLGGSPQTSAALGKWFRDRYPDCAPPVFQHGFTDLEDASAAENIAAVQPRVLFLGMGSPKQYEWALRYRDRISVPAIVIVGGGLEFLAGTKPRAPLWMRKIGLEWMHRLALEPSRMWKRYLLGIPEFAYLVARQKFGGER
jgi:N-acetylglucosaminyldiphosphoundecaprenol N-acetyl-beta-D-mannosaminyltransferase